MTHPLLFIALLSLWLAPSASQDCKSVVDTHLRTRTKEAVPYSEDKLVFFLHVPRTAGRTFHTCLLKPGTPEERRCPRAYDHLRIKAEVPNCYLLSSHDDFSVVDMMSKDLTVVNQFRDPVDRFLSAYEFAIELASRSLKRKKPLTRKKGRTLTEDVWPWSYFIPWFKNDLQQRVAELNKAPQPEGGVWVQMHAEDGKLYHFNKRLNETRWPKDGVDYGSVLPPLDPYNNPLAMPLEEFVKHPIAKELLHEGGMLQVLGVTNYSHFSEAREVRECLFSDAESHERLLQVALKRLGTFAHVGTIDRLDDSVRSAAASLRLKLDAPAFSAKPGLPPRRQVLMQQGASGHELEGGARAGQDDDTEAYDTDEDAEEADGDRASDDEAGSEGDLESGERGAAAPGDSGGSASSDEGDVAQEQLTPDAASEELAQATAALEDAHDQLQHALKAGGSSEEVQQLRQRLTEAKDSLRSAQDALLAARAELPARRRLQLQPAKRREQPRDEQGRLRTRDSLASLYRRCMSRSHAGNKRRKRTSLTMLQMPDGRSITFSKAARASLPEHIIKAIRDMSPGDTALHKRAQSLLEEQLQRQQQQGVLQQLPPMQKPGQKHKHRRHPLHGGLLRHAGKELHTMSSEEL